MKFSPKFFYGSLGVLLLSSITTEVLLRSLFGLGNPVLLQADPEIGYRFQPNQKVVRFGKSIEYNQYSQRSESITRDKPSGTLRILMVGDSVLNGGSPTDQQDIISERLEAKLSTPEQEVEVLNASSGSWGIGNQLGYLRQFGTFNSDLVILQIGTHDLIQPKSTGDRIGNDPNFPNQRPVLAITEAFTRYLVPRIKRQLKLRSVSGEIPKTSQPEVQFKQNQRSLQAILNLIRQQEIPVFVLFTPNRIDLLPNPKTPRYKLEFLQILESSEVAVIDSHTTWSNLPSQTVESYFRDTVHLSVAGNEAIADLIVEQINSQLLDKISFHKDKFSDNTEFQH